jgi:proliferating cell nuclear antigen PCNA
MLKRIRSDAFIHRMDPRGDYTFRLRTVKAASVRTLFDGIKEILTEANIEIDPLGIKIMAMDGTHTILVHMRLHADRFDEFHCPTKTIFGVNMMNLNKFLKGITSDDHLVMYQSRANQSKLNLIKLNGEKQMSTDMDLNLMELDIKPIEIPPVHFTSIITMPTAPRHITISEVEVLTDASLTHTPIRENTKLANSIHNDCMPLSAA